MVSRIAAIPTTLSNLQGRSLFSPICKQFPLSFFVQLTSDETSTDIARRAVFLL